MQAIKRRIVGTPLHGLAERYLRGPVATLRAARHPDLAAMHREPQLVSACLDRVVEADTNCLDVGAHIGSVLAELTARAPDGRHVAVEATPDKARRLAAKFPDATILPFAVSDHEGTATFRVFDEASGYNGLAASGQREGGTEIEVEVRRLDDALPEGWRPGLVKIDVEGHELAALRGARRTLDEARPVLLFECGPVAGEREGRPSGDDLYAFLTGELDYDVYSPIDLAYGREPMTIEEFRKRRVFPFTGWNNFAMPRGRRVPPVFA